MKTTNLYRLLFATTLSCLLFTACKKSNSDSSSSTTSSTDLQTQSDDEARVSTESSAAFDDANAAMIGESSVTGAGIASNLRFGVAVDGGNGSDGATILYRSPIQPSADGNTVDMDVERNQFADNALHYEAGLTMITSQIKDMLSVLQS